MYNKKGSHVGIILSFVIFITFLVFLYTVIKPVTDIGQDKRTTLEYLKIKVIENVSANFTSTSVQINKSANPNRDCVTLQNFLLPSELNPPHIKIKNEEGDMEDAYYNALEDFSNLRIDRENSDTTFFKVYQSPEFSLPNNETLNCDMVDETEYQRGLIKVDKYIFEENLDGLINYYETNYEQLKEELKISPADEFWFSFTKSNGTKVEPEQEIKSGNIYADEIPIQYIDKDINILSGFINMKVW